MTALTGDIIRKLQTERSNNAKVIIPCNEGSDVEGQYSRLLETFISNSGIRNTRIQSFYIEDMIDKEWEDLEPYLLNIIAGDIILAQENSNKRRNLLTDVRNLIKNGKMNEADFFELINNNYSSISKRKDTGRR